MRAERLSHRQGRMARFRAKARSRPFATLLVANIVPLVVALGLAIAYVTGSIRFVPEARTVIPSLLLLLGSLAVLAVLAWVVAPLLLPAMRGTSAFINAQTQAMANGSVVSFVARMPLLVGGMILYGVLCVNAFLVALMIAADILAIVASLALFAADVWKARG